MRHNIEDSNYTHTPVLWEEVLKFSKAVSWIGNRTFVDCTLGEGGHSELLLSNIENIKIIGIERDKAILDIAMERLKKYGNNMEFINDNFSNISKYFSKANNHFAGFLYDFGISSFHFEKSGRGFSFNNDEELDMRLSADEKLTARYIINNYPEVSLREIFTAFGEERWAKRIARVICELRKKKAINTSGELAKIIENAIPKKFHMKNIHPATRIFQALRIEVNNELQAIEKTLKDSYQYLAPGGIVMAISFHSLEDRIVKNTFRRLSKGCLCGAEPKYCNCANDPFVDVLTKKPVVPSGEELKNNRRARSAKFRVCVKL